MKLFRLLLLLLPLSGLKAQNLTGIWQGYFVSSSGERYKYEIQVLQSSSNGLTGVSYSYLDTRFYGKAELNGNFTRGSKTALINELKTVELRMAGGSVACIMKCQLRYASEGGTEYLTGQFSSAYEKSDSSNGTFRGGNCGGGRVYLERVELSDFYVEPFLRTKPAVRKAPVIAAKPPARPPSRAPAKNPPPKAKPKVTTTPKPPPVRRDSMTVQRKPVETVPSKPAPVKVSVPLTTRSRTNELSRVVNVENADVTVRLYDNGEIDNDTISVYMDGKLLLDRKRLSATPLTINLKMDEAHPEHVLVMVAENLGRIPPNTSLMIVQDGDRRYEVRITSTEQKNAAVQFRYSKSP